MGEVKFITAKEARKITEDSDFLLRNTYKWIKEAAVRNCDSIPFDTYDYDEGMVKHIFQVLEKDGYTVDKDTSSGDNMYYIRW